MKETEEENRVRDQLIKNLPTDEGDGGKPKGHKYCR